MANNPFYADATVEAALSALGGLLDGGFVEVYTGAQPTDANTAIGSQVLLATCTLSTPAFSGIAASGTAPNRVVTMTAAAILAATAVATGTAAWFRAFQPDGVTVVMDGSCGVSGSFDMLISSTAVLTGDTVSITGWTLTQAE